MRRRSIANIPGVRWVWALGVLAALLLLVVDSRGVTSRRHLQAAEVVAEEGHAYVIELEPVWPLTAPADDLQETRSVTEIFEDGRPLGPAHSAHQDIRDNGSGRFSHWQGALYFSSSDNSDPRTNGREYSALLSVHLAPSARLALTVILLLTAVRALWIYRRRLGGRLRRVLLSGDDPVTPGPRAREFFVLFGPLTTVSLVVVALCAPFISTDGSILATAEMNDFVVPHFPPLYPLFLRTINALVHNTSVLLGLAPDGLGFEFSLYRPAPYGNTSIYIAILLQHLLLAAAATWFALSITRRWWLRIATAGLLAWGPSLLAPAQRIQTEGLWHPLVILALAFGVRYLAGIGRPLPNLALYFATTGLGMLVRHPGAVVLAAVPLALFYSGAAAAIRHRRLPPLFRQLRAGVLAAGLGLLTLTVVFAVQRVVLIACGVEPRSVSGRAGAYRLQPAQLEPWERVSARDLEAVVASLERRAGDEATRRTLRIIAETSGWVDAFNRVRVEIVEPAHPQYGWQQTLAATDRALNAAARLTLTSTDPRAIRGVAFRSLRFLHFGPHAKGPPKFYLESAARYDEQEYLHDPSLARVRSARDQTKLRRYGGLQWFHQVWARPVLGKMLWLVIGALGILAMVRGTFDRRASAAAAVTTTAVIYALLMAIASVFTFRYQEVMIIFQVCAAALLLASVVERTPNRSRSTSEESRSG